MLRRNWTSQKKPAVRYNHLSHMYNHACIYKIYVVILQYAQNVVFCSIVMCIYSYVFMAICFHYDLV